MPKWDELNAESKRELMDYWAWIEENRGVFLPDELAAEWSEDESEWEPSCCHVKSKCLF